MQANEAKHFLNKHCLIKLKTGKEVFGVIWEVISGGRKLYYFASAREYQLLQEYNANRNGQAPRIGQPIRPEDIVYAKSLIS